MNITLLDKELDVYEEEHNPFDNSSVFNYCKTMAGHTITIDPDYYLEPVKDIPNVFIIKKKVKGNDEEKRIH